MFWCIGGIYGNIGYIIASKGLDTFINIGGTIIVAMETDITEVCFYQTWFKIGYTNSGVGHI